MNQDSAFNRIVKNLITLLSGERNSIDQAILSDDRSMRQFARICHTHGIHHLVAFLLNERADNKAEILPLTSALCTDTAARMAFLMGAQFQAKQLAGQFKKQQIPVIFFKGIVLANTVYADHPLNRLFGDIDILIPFKFFDTAIETMVDLGYTLASHKQDIASLRKYNRKLCFRPPPGRTCSIDVHFQLFGKKLYTQTACLSEAFFFKHARQIVVGNETYWVPREELHFLYLLIHFSLQHHLASLGWMYDIKHLLARSQDWDWDFLGDTVAVFKVKRSVWLSLAATKKHLKATPPPRFCQRIQPSPLGPLERAWFGAQLNGFNIACLAHHYHQQTLLGKASRMFSEVLLIDRKADRVRAILKWAFPDPALLRTSYRLTKAWQIVLAYMAHPFVLLFFLISIGVLSNRYRNEPTRQPTTKSRYP